MKEIKTIEIDSMMSLEKVKNMIRRSKSRPNFEKARIEKHSITLSQLINNLSNNIFYMNLLDGFVETKENILLICKQYSMKVVCWDYVRMMAIIEPEEENCLNCKDAFWCATYRTYKKVLKCKHWSMHKRLEKCNKLNLEELRSLIFQNIKKQTDLVETIHFVSINKI